MTTRYRCPACGGSNTYGGDPYPCTVCGYDGRPLESFVADRFWKRVGEYARARHVRSESVISDEVVQTALRVWYREPRTTPPTDGPGDDAFEQMRAALEAVQRELLPGWVPTPQQLADMSEFEFAAKDCSARLAALTEKALAVVVWAHYDFQQCPVCGEEVCDPDCRMLALHDEIAKAVG